jgi:hypothetical protein
MQKSSGKVRTYIARHLVKHDNKLKEHLDFELFENFLQLSPEIEDIPRVLEIAHPKIHFEIDEQIASFDKEVGQEKGLTFSKIEEEIDKTMQGKGTTFLTAVSSNNLLKFLLLFRSFQKSKNALYEKVLVTVLDILKHFESLPKEKTTRKDQSDVSMLESLSTSKAEIEAEIEDKVSAVVS